MADEEVLTPPEDTDANDDAELTADEVVIDTQGNKSVSLTTMLKYKREAKANAKRVKELEPVAQRVTELDGRLNEASPIINAVLNNPRLKAEAIRIAQGGQTRPSHESTEQPDDAEAAAFAENVFGFYLPDGTTPDAARARRAMDLLDRRTGQQTDAKVGKVARVVAGSEANHNIARAIAETDAEGLPIATEESIREVVTLMGMDGRDLLANPQVVDMILTLAAGKDRRAGRTPKHVEEPLYLDSPGSGRGSRTPPVDADMKGFLDRQGISEKDYQRSVKNLEEGIRNRKGIPLGGKS